MITLLLACGVVAACERKSEPVPDAGNPLMQAKVDGVAWQTNDASITTNSVNGVTAIEGWVEENDRVASAIHIVLLDDVRVGDYTEQAYPIYYEDDFSKGWATLDGYNLRITRIENGKAWGTFSFTGYDNAPDSVRHLTEGMFENLPVE